MSTIIQSALFIFTLRIVDVSLSTLRIMMVVRGRKAWAMTFGFFQALIFVVAIRGIFSDILHLEKVIGYGAGFATGLVVGMFLEERLAIGFTHLRVVSAGRSAELVERLRSEGFAVTEIPSRGLNGTVAMLSCNVQRRRTKYITRLIDEIDPQAFVTAQAVRPVQRGFW